MFPFPRNSRSLLSFWIGVVFALIASGSIFAQNAVPATDITNSQYLRRVHQGDLIDVHVAGHLDFDWRGRLNPEGFLDGFDKIPDRVYALCRTELEIAAEINKILSVHLRGPKTEVRILDTSQRSPAIINGAIATPTRFQIRREVRLIEIIAAAGGISDRSSGTIGIIRPQGQSCIDHLSSRNSGKPIEITIRELLSGDRAANPMIASGDLIVVAEAPPVYIVGAVAAQGRVDHRPQLTVSRLIDASGGLLKDAELSQVTIFRRAGNASETISVDIEKVRSDPSLDVELKPHDLIDVPFKGRPPRKFPPVNDIDGDRSADRTKYPLKIID